MTAKKAAPVVPAASSFGHLRSANASLLRRFAAPALVACIGIAAGLGLFAMVRNWELSRAARDFEGHAQERITAVESHMYLHARSLDTLRALFLASQNVERWEFIAFADVVMAPESEIRLLGWIARVPESRREAYEQARRNEGFEDFAIHPWSQSDQNVVAREGDWLFPIHFVEPQEGRAMLGLDLSSNPTCQAAMERARDTGDAAATAPLLLGGEMADQRSVIIFLPIYEKDAPTISTEERRESLAGFVFGAYLVNDVLVHAIKPLVPGEINLLVLDISTSPDGQFLGVHWSRSIRPPAQGVPPTLADWRESELSEAVTFNVAGRSWQVLCTPTELFIATRTTWGPWLSLLSAWGLTGLLVAYLQTIRTGRSRSEGLAMELADANESLLTEMHERESANDDLRASEQQFKTLVANVPGVTYRCACDERWTMEFISDEIERLSGYPTGDFLASAVRSYASIIHPDDRQMVENVVLEGVQNKSPYTIEYRIVHADGEPRWVYERGQGIFDDEGNVEWLDGVIVEVTERKQAEGALQESEERHRTLFESSRDAIMTLAPPSWKFTAGNAAAVEMFGAKDEAEFSSLAPWQLSPESQADGGPSVDKAIEMIETAVREGSHLFDWTHKRVGGEEFPATVLLTRMEFGGQTLLQATVRDITMQKAAEEALRESEQRYRAIFESAAEGILIADIETKKFLFANPAVSAMLGYSEGELLNMGIQDIHPPEDMPRNIARFEAAATGKTKVILDIPCVRKDGTIVFVDINTGMMLLDGREYLIGLFTDVTERRQAERAVKFQAMLLDQIDDQVTATDLQGKITYVNVAEARDKGFTKAELIGQSVEIFGEDPDFGATQMEIVERTLRDGRWEGEIVNYTKRGERRILQVRTRLIHDPQGQPTALCGISTDITDRKAAEDALRESEKRYRQLVEGLNEGIAATDRSGTITFVNRAFAEIIGDSAEALVGSDFFGSINNYQRDAFRRAFLDPSIGSPDYQIMLLRRDDKLLYLSMQGSPIMDDQGNHLGTLIVINDITQRRQAEESLKKAHRQLMYAGEQERHAIAKDLHDSLGQQAVAMHLAVESLLTRAKQADNAYVQELARLSQTCESLTEDIRNTCYGLYPPTLEMLGLCAALRQLLRDNEHIINAKMACCEKCEDIRLAPDIEIALFRIAQEAVSNVLRHGKAEHMELNLYMDGMDVVLTVSDDGVDFDVENTEAGLGLLSMRERANAVGGSLEISSQPGRTSVIARILVGEEH